MNKTSATEIFLLLIVVVIEVLLFGWFVMLLWNYNIPAIFPGVNTITYGQGIGLFGLGRILTCGFSLKDRD
jgi:hypothetical protein